MSGHDWLSHCLQPIVSHIFNWRRLYRPNSVEAQLLCTWRPWVSTLHTFKMKVRPMFKFSFLKKLSLHRYMHSFMLTATYVFTMFLIWIYIYIYIHSIGVVIKTWSDDSYVYFNVGWLTWADTFSVYNKLEWLIWSNFSSLWEWILLSLFVFRSSVF